MSVALGVTLPQFTADRDRIIDAARHAEALGLDSIWLFDHVWPLSGDKERPILEQWTTLAYIAAETERVTIGTLVTRSSMRRPAVLAKMAATVATIAPGRLVVTLGSGDSLNRAENEAFDLPYYAGDDRTLQLVSTAEIVRTYLSGRPVTAVNPFAAVEDLAPSPVPPVAPRLWIGGNSRRAFDAAVRGGDGWNAWGKRPAWYRDRARVELPPGFELTWAGQGRLEGSGGGAGSADARSGDHVSGPPERFADGLRGFAEAGARHLIVSFPNASADAFEALATRVKPLLDEMVD